MVEPEGRLAKLRPLIDREAWFGVHAPRQSGKTTTTRLLAEALTVVRSPGCETEHSLTPGLGCMARPGVVIRFIISDLDQGFVEQ